MKGEERGRPEPAVARVKRHGRFSPVWLIPIVAGGLVVYLAYDSFAKRGPELTLTMATADGLTVDQTQVKHKAVALGTVDDISLASDMKSVKVKVRMVGGTSAVLTDQARFWVVRPRLSSGSLTGLETLVSGAYIEVDPGRPGGKKQLEFTALKEPPGRQTDEPGHVFVLKAARLGSLGVGTRVYYRDVDVGEVLSSDLGDGLGPVSLRVFVREPFDRFVHAQTRFWNASGLSVTMGPEGMHVEVESLQSLLGGSIAFETPRSSEGGAPAEDSATFDLYADKATADSALYRENIPYVTYFQTSVQGLGRGSPVQLFGVQVGSVSDVQLVYDPDHQSMVARVAFEIQPERILDKKGAPDTTKAQDLRKALAESGLHVVLESSSLLTGSKDLALLRSPPRGGAASLPTEGEAIVIPGEGGGLDSLTGSLSEIARRVEQVPFEAIGRNANATLTSVQHLASQIDAEAAPALAQLTEITKQLSEVAQRANGALGPTGYGQNSEFQRGMERTMNQVNDAARSLRVLADYLDRHPEALIRGRASQAGER